MNGSGLDHWTPDRVEHFGPRQGLLNGHVWSVVQDSSGPIWAGTWGGLFKLETNQFLKLSDGREIGGVVLAIYESRAGGLWLGQQALGALTRLRADEKTATRIPGASVSLDVRVMVEDSAGYLWIGSQDEGLYRWQNGHCVHFGKADGLGSLSIWSLRADADGTVWIGTCGGGLSRWRRGKITTWTTKHGLVNDVICQILEDDHGNLWLGSYGGVFRINRVELELSARREGGPAIHCIGYGKADGLPSIECQGGFQPSGLRSRDGRLCFPTIKGLAVVQPDQVASNSVTPLVIVEDLVADGRSQMSVVTMTDPKATNRAPPPVLRILPGEKNLEFRYTATSLTAPEKVRFKYRLAGLESDWLDAGAKRTITYSRVPPGDYAFQVTACNNDGVWNTTGATCAVIVLPHFWQTKGLLIASALAALAGAAGLANFVAARRMRYRLERVERERAVERERRRIAQDMHDDLGSHLTEIALLSEFAQNTESPPEAVRADAHKIMIKARALTASLDEIVWAVDPANDSLESFVTYACSFAENYLRIARMACRLELPDQLPHVVLLTEVRHNLFLTFKEALNNAVKHSRASEVRIHITHVAGVFTVTIRDNGIGLANGAELNPQVAPGDSTGDLPGQRTGLVNMRERMAAIHGRCEVGSGSNPGTSVKLTVALSVK